MNKNPAPQSGFAMLRVVVAFTLCLGGALLAVLSFAAPAPSTVTDAGANSTGESAVVDPALAGLPPAAASALRGFQSKFPFDPLSPDGGVTPFGPATQGMPLDPRRRNTIIDSTSRSMPLDPMARQTRFDPMGRMMPSDPTASAMLPSATRSGAIAGDDADPASADPTESDPSAPSWSVFPSPNVEGAHNTLSDVTCVSSSDCWAVGYSNFDPFTGDPRVNTFILHWDGSSWSTVASPNATSATGEPERASVLLGVTCTSSSSCWAVGYSGSGGTFEADFEQSLTMRWDGTSWSVVPSPSTPGAATILSDVTCVSAEDCWAVGYYYPTVPVPAAASSKTLTMRWDGTAWAIVPSPNVVPSNPQPPDKEQYYSYLAGVTCVSASDCWAVGAFYVLAWDPYTETWGLSSSQTLVARWDGIAWTIVASPNTAVQKELLSDVTCVSAVDCWAVGSSDSAKTLTMRWDGTAWAIVASPNAERSANLLKGVTCVSAADCWTVGSLGTSSGQTLFLHWDGSSWTLAASPVVTGEINNKNEMLGVTCVSESDCWAVGRSANKTLMVRYAPAGSPTPTPTATPTATATPTPTASPNPTASPPASPFPTASPIPTETPTNWSTVRTPNFMIDRAEDNLLADNACVSASDCWSVGYSQNTPHDPFRTLIQRWDGVSWRIVRSPNIDGWNNVLAAVTCTSASHCIAGGYYWQAGGASPHTLLLKWDGSSWTILPSPDGPARGIGMIRDVTCVSESDCWAVGSESFAPLILHWDGTSWTVVPSPKSESSENLLNGVTCASASDCWAVGRKGSSSAEALIMHWDGSSWAVVTPPSSGQPPDELYDVTCVSSSDCWAVGFSREGGFSTGIPLIMRWDGTSWAIVASPHVGFTSTVSDVTCLSASDCWAVGASIPSSDSSNTYDTFILRWDGNDWTITTSPNTSPSPSDRSQANALTGVSCVSATDCWVTGLNRSSGWYQTLTQRWNGTSWTIVPSPNTRGGKQTNVLNDVTCVSESDCWAVGYWNTGYVESETTPGVFNTFDLTLIQRWNGTEWSIVPSPNLDKSVAARNVLTDVTCVSASDCWAVGQYETYSTTGRDPIRYQTLILRWNGTSWAIVPSPTSLAADYFLDAVTCTSASDCWAVGISRTRVSGSKPQTLIVRWNGAEWATVPSANTDPLQTNVLYDVACASPSNCWAVGYAHSDGSRYPQTLIERWNGNSWSIVSSPNATGAAENVLYGLTCVSGSDCWAVGASVFLDAESGAVSVQTLAERWDGTSWSVVPSANVTSSKSNYLRGVTCTSASNCWAVGDFFFSGSGPTGNRVRSLTERWDGASWSVVPSSNISLSQHNRAVAVTCPSPSDCWAVGLYANSDTPLQPVYQTVAWKYTPSASPTPTPSPSPSVSPSPTASPSPTVQPTVTPTATPQPSVSPTPTPEPSASPTPTPQPSVSPTASPTPTASPSPTAEPSPTASPTPTPEPSPSPTASPTPTAEPSPTASATPTPNPTPSPSPTPGRPVQLMNISTRVPVGAGDEVGIAGFILQGNAAKKVIVRAIGPSMQINGEPVAGRLMDPMLALHNKEGALIASNDDWRTSQEGEIAGSGLAPTHDKEAAILMRLDSANYTAIIRGAGENTGLGLVEVYDIESAADARLANISTRGQVGRGDEVLIGGVIVRGDTPQKMLLRAIGPDLTSKGVPGALQDPTLELYDQNGTLLMENDNWQDNQRAEIEATGIPPNHERESAIVRELGAGNYTAVVRGYRDSTGVALVEAYNLGSP